MRLLPSFDSVVREQQEAVRGFLLHLAGGNGALADDLAQDTFVRAWQHYTAFRGLSGVRTWLLRIAYHVWCDHVRAQRPVVSLDATPLPPRAAATRPAGAAHDIAAALALLTDDERVACVLQLIEGERIDHIAHITGEPEGTIKSRLARGKAKMARWLRENGYR